MRFECHNICLIFNIPNNAYIDKVQQGNKEQAN